MLRIRDDAFAQLGDRDLGDRRVQGRRRASDARRRPRSTATTRIPRPPGQGARGDDRRPLLPRPARVRPGSRFNPRPGRPCRRPRRATCSWRTSAASCRASATAGPRPRGCPSTATGCWATTARSCDPNLPAMADEHDIVFCATRGRGCPTRTSRNAVSVLQDLGQMPRSPTGCSRGCSTPLPRAADDPPAGARHSTALLPPTAGPSSTRATSLRRQQPGRDHGRRADGLRARLHPRRPRRPGHELQRPAAALGRLRHLRSSSSTRRTPTSSSARWCSTSPSSCGTAARPTASHST